MAKVRERVLLRRKPITRTLLVLPTFGAIVRKARSVTFFTLTLAIVRVCSLLLLRRLIMRLAKRLLGLLLLTLLAPNL